MIIINNITVLWWWGVKRSNNFLAKPEIIKYDMGLTSLEVGSNGDYTVKSSEELYTSSSMLDKLLEAYKNHSKGKKTLIFNNGINTSIQVFYAFKSANIPIAHLDNTTSKKDRAMILKWFKETPDAILTSVSLLTTGFDEPTINTIILNRATKSLTLYFQMIGRGSRILKEKNTFKVIDLGNNCYRFGPWGADVNWQSIFKSPNFYADKLLTDEAIEKNFVHQMPPQIREQFAKSNDVSFDIKKTYLNAVDKGESSKVVLEKSIEQHTKICVENSEDVYDALGLVKVLDQDIDIRINDYAKCISKSTHNFISWLREDYKKKLKSYIRANFDEIYKDINGVYPEE